MNRASLAIVDRITPQLSSRGFKFTKANESFVKRDKFGFNKLLLASFSMGGDRGGWYEVHPGLGVRHDAVDDIVNALGHIWGDKNQRNTTTVFRSLTHFPFDDGLSAIKIYGDTFEHDVDQASQAILAMLDRHGFEFVECYSSLEACSIGLNHPIEVRSHPLHNGFPLRAYYGVAAASLTQPSRVPTLIRSYTDFIESHALPDPLVYDVGKELTGAEAINFRLRSIASMAGC